VNEIQEVARSRGRMGASGAELCRRRRPRLDDALRFILKAWLPRIREIPRGRAFVHFDGTERLRAKDLPRGHLGIRGNVPPSLPRTPVDDVRPENLKALIDLTVEYGVYA
jgi:hypothetical protein